MSAGSQRYTAVAIVLHWAIAIAILGMIPLGWWMGDALENPATQAQAVAAFQLHKSVGLTILLLSLVRLGWRLMHRPPALPAHMPAWETFAAKATHWAFYFIIIVMPLTGWLYVSTAWNVHDERALNVSTLYFGLFQIPHLFGLSHLADGARSDVAGVLETIHSKLAWGAIVLLVLHVGAALKHHFVDKDEVLTHMIPGLKPPNGSATPAAPGRAPALIAGFAAIAIAASSALFMFVNPPTGAGAAPAEVMHTHEGGEDHGTDDALGPPPTPSTTADDHNADGHTHDAAAPTPAATSGPPPTWRVDQSASSIRFSGTHAGINFTGAFARWSADIRFDPNNLDASTAIVTIQTGSAADGIPLHDQSMPEAEWFDVATHPTATFRTTRIRSRGEGRFEADGTLTLKGRGLDIDLPFTLTINGNRATMDGAIEIDRRDANLGQASDPDAEYVSREIGVRVHVEATRAP
ncbi:cytochrome B561 [alpha proteobacterium U9-1i]|nr:cytochrome B561 [alpha proteobacterium U9-1i]